MRAAAAASLRALRQDSWNSEILRASRARGCEEHGAGDVNIALLLGDPEVGEDLALGLDRWKSSAPAGARSAAKASGRFPGGRRVGCSGRLTASGLQKLLAVCMSLSLSLSLSACLSV